MANNFRPAGDESDFDTDEELMLEFNYQPISDKLASRLSPTQIVNSQNLATRLSPTQNDKSQNVSLNQNEENEDLENGVDIIEPVLIKSRQKQDPLKLNDLRVSCMQGNLKQVSKLIEEGFIVDELLKDSWSCLMYACSFAQSEIVEFLLENGADPNFHKDMFTSLMAVCSSSSEDEPELLKCAEALLRCNATVNISEKHGMTPLMFAAKKGSVEIVKLLISKGADVNAQDDHGWTALMWGSSKGNGLVIHELLIAKADVTKVNNSCETAADIAYSSGFNKIYEVLQNVKENHKYTESSNLPEKEYSKKKEFDSVANLSGSGKKGFRAFRELEIFLGGLELQNLYPLFEDHSISFKQFLGMTDEDLQKVGVDKIGSRKKILDAISRTHKKQWERSSIHSFHSNKTNNNAISNPELSAIIVNITQHVSYIQSTIGYLSTHLQSNPLNLEIGEEAVSVKQLSEETLKAMQNVSFLQSELSKFHLNLMQTVALKEPAPDLLSKNSKNKRPSFTWQVKTLVILSGLVGLGSFLSFLPRNFSFPRLLPFK